MRALAALSLALATGCVDVGQQGVALSLQVAGKPPQGNVETTDGWSIDVERAELAFGPFYLCAGYQAGALCEDARAEWLSSAVVNALDAEAYEIGSLMGVTGSTHSWMYDLGITSLLTKPDPEVLSAAASLGGNSVLLEGIARRAPHEIPFGVELPIQQEEGVEIGVCVVRKSSSDRFGHELSKDDVALVVRFDPAGWFRNLAFDELVREESCSPGGLTQVCAGMVALTCSPDGSLESERDCSLDGLACASGQGCVERARFAPESQGHRAVRSALIAGQRPDFEWITAP